MQKYTKDQIEHIVRELERITVRGLPVFRVDLLDYYSTQPIGLNDAHDRVRLDVHTHSNVGIFEFTLEEE